MSDPHRIDSHKLIYHPQRVADWQRGVGIMPIYLEIAPSGSCNHRCIFCAVDYMDYRREFLRIAALKKAVRQGSRLGVKSIMYAGEGEPLLHEDIARIVRFTKAQGIDVSITTNGVFLKKDLAEKILPFLSWLRVSFNAGSASTYAKVHRARPEDFDQVLVNLRNAVLIKKRKKLPVTIGVQLLLIPQNIREVVGLAHALKKIGVDYLAIKPYSQHPLSGARMDPRFRYADTLALGKKLEALSDKKFQVIFRSGTMERLKIGKDYAHCYGLPFWAYITATGDVYACSAFLSRREYVYGNIYKKDLGAILKSVRRRKIIRRAATELDVRRCREVCRLDKINEYLWELKHPGPHVNFI